MCVPVLSHYQSVEWGRSATEYDSLSLKMSLEGYWCINKNSLDIWVYINTLKANILKTYFGLCSVQKDYLMFLLQ